MLALLPLVLLTASDGRFWRTDQRTPEGRTHRGFQAVNSPGGPGAAPFFSFAPASGAGLGGNCSCSGVTDATGSIPMAFSRATQALCVSGQTFAMCDADEPRIQDGAFLREPAATNLFTRSDLFSAGIWAKSGITVTEDYALSPLGTMTADRVEIPACPSNGTFNVIYQGVTTSTGTAAQVWVKGTSGSGVLQGYSYGGGNGTATACNYNPLTWVNCQHIRATGQTEAGFGCVNYTLVTGPGDTGAADVLLWRGQLEDSSFCTSVIETGPAAVARALESTLEGVFSAPLAAGDFCIGVSAQKTNSGFSANEFAIITDNSNDDILAAWIDDVTISLSGSSTGTTPTVPSIGTTLHRLIWGNASGVGAATWDGASIAAPNDPTSQPNDRILIGAGNTLTSRVVVDVSGCQ